MTSIISSELASAYLAEIVASSNDAIFGENLEGTITSWNMAAERIFGFSASEAIGQHITLIIPPELHIEEKEILGAIRAGKKIEHFETVRVAKDGRRINLSITVSPIRDGSGEIVGASKIARDISNTNFQRLGFLHFKTSSVITPIHVMACSMEAEHLVLCEGGHRLR